MKFIKKLADFGTSVGKKGSELTSKGIGFGKSTYSAIQLESQKMHSHQQRKKAHELQELREKRLMFEGQAKLHEAKEKEILLIKRARRKMGYGSQQRKIPNIMKGFGL